MRVDSAVDSGVENALFLSTFGDIPKNETRGRQVDNNYTQLLGYSYIPDIKGKVDSISKGGWVMSTRCLLPASCMGIMSTCLPLAFWVAS